MASVGLGTTITSTINPKSARYPFMETLSDLVSVKAVGYSQFRPKPLSIVFVSLGLEN